MPATCAHPNTSAGDSGSVSERTPPPNSVERVCPGFQRVKRRVWRGGVRRPRGSRPSADRPQDRWVSPASCSERRTDRQVARGRPRTPHIWRLATHFHAPVPGSLPEARHAWIDTRRRRPGTAAGGSALSGYRQRTPPGSRRSITATRAPQPRRLRRQLELLPDRRGRSGHPPRLGV